jgi:cytochrome bd-type quinol oxidase subunit 2
MWAQVGLMIITIGFYAIYWFYVTAEEMQDIARDRNANPALWTFLLFIPFGAIYSHYKYGELYEKISPDNFNRWLLFTLWLVFAPAVWFIVQSELNRRANYNRPDQQTSVEVVQD